MVTPQTEVIITVNGAECGRYIIEPGEFVIGRDPDCAIKVEADLVSRRHAKLTLNFDHAIIEDLNSSHGTQVNGKPVVGSTRLWPNQKIQIGAATVELHRLKSVATPDTTLAPTTEVLRRVLPEEFLREKKYAIGDVVARGGMGAILNAREATTDRTVAMKVMLDTNDAEALARFLNEAKITAQLEHPNIVPVHELSVDENGQVFYTMKMVRGITLKKVLELLAQGVETTVKKYPLAAVLTIFQKVCDALAFAHSKGVIHRDLKPENIMLADYGEVLVMDWGLAKVLDSGRAKASDDPSVDLHSIGHTAPAGGGTDSKTLAGTVMGTPHFMSPEQARGEVETLDARSDIYSLGAILFQILTLRLPVEGTDAWDIVGKVGRGEIEPLECGGNDATLGRCRGRAGGEAQPGAEASPGAPHPAKSAVAAPLCQRTPKRAIPDSLAAVVKKAMAFDKAARYARVEDLQADILAYQNGFATSAENAGAWKQLTLLVKRHKALFGSAAAAAVIIAAVVAVAFRHVAGERNVAVTERNRAETALTDLAKTAPTFAAQARGLVEQGNLADALEKIGYAVSLDKGNADYLLQQAHLLQATQQLARAAECYRGVLAFRADAAAKLNLELCEKLLRENDGRPELKRESQEALVNAMIQQGRAVEAAPLVNLVSPNSEAALAAIQARLKPITAVAVRKPILKRLPNGSFSLAGGWDVDFPALAGLPITEVLHNQTKVSDLTPLKGLRLRRLEIGTTPVADLSPIAGMPLEYLTAGGTKISDLTPLKGMPLTELVLNSNRGVSDLSPLRGIPLRKLNLSSTSAADLRPLAGMPLEELDISSTGVSDLSPLAGMPLRLLNAGGTKIVDLTPARGMPLRVLILSNAPVQDLSPLAGMPIEELYLSGAKVTDIGVLRTLPLKRLNVYGQVKDLRPLADCKALETLVIPKVTTDISFLRALPNLQRLTDEPGWDVMMDRISTAEQFWQKYDAQRDAPK